MVMDASLKILQDPLVLVDGGGFGNQVEQLELTPDPDVVYLLSSWTQGSRSCSC